MSYMQLLCCRDFSKSQVRKGKKLIRVFRKQHGFASQDFLVVRDNDWGFYGVAGTPAASRGWGCVKMVSEQDLRKPVLLSIVVFLYTIYTTVNHAFSNSKYIHMRCFKVLNN